MEARKIVEGEWYIFWYSTLTVDLTNEELTEFFIKNISNHINIGCIVHYTSTINDLIECIKKQYGHINDVNCACAKFSYIKDKIEIKYCSTNIKEFMRIEKISQL